MHAFLEGRDSSNQPLEKKKNECIGAEKGLRVLEENIYIFNFMVLFERKKIRYKKFQVTYFAFIKGR